jgi:hypothetical protein
VASQGYPTLQLRQLVRRAIDLWDHTYKKILPVYGLWDFDLHGLTQVLIFYLELIIVIYLGVWLSDDC